MAYTMDAAGAIDAPTKSGPFDFETMGPGLVPSLNQHASFPASAQALMRSLTKLGKADASNAATDGKTIASTLKLSEATLKQLPIEFWTEEHPTSGSDLLSCAATPHYAKQANLPLRTQSVQATTVLLKWIGEPVPFIEAPNSTSAEPAAIKGGDASSSTA